MHIRKGAINVEDKLHSPIFRLYIEDPLCEITVEDFYDIKIKDSDVLERLKKVYPDAAKFTIWHIANEFNVYPLVSSVSSDTEDEYDVTELYEKLRDKIINSLYVIYLRREKDYAKLLSKNNSSYLLNEWNSFRKNIYKRYNTLKNSIEIANYILSATNTKNFSKTEDFKKYYSSEKESITSIIDRVQSRTEDKVSELDKDTMDIYIYSRYAQKIKKYISKDALTAEKNLALKNVLSDTQNFNRLFKKLLKKGILLENTGSTYRLYAVLGNNKYLSYSKDKKVNDRLFLDDTNDDLKINSKYYIKYLDPYYSYEKQSELYAKQAENISVENKKHFLKEFEALKKDQLYNTFLKLRNIKLEFDRINTILNDVFDKCANSDELKKISIDLNENLTSNVKTYEKDTYSVSECENILSSLQNEYTETYNKELIDKKRDKPSKKAYKYMRFLFLSEYFTKNPYSVSSSGVLFITQPKSDNEITTDIRNTITPDVRTDYEANISDVYCDIDDILEYLDIETLTSDKILRFIELAKVRENFTLSEYSDEDIKKLLTTFGGIGVNISNRIKHFKRNYIKNTALKKLINVKERESTQQYTSKKYADLTKRLAYLKKLVKYVGKIKNSDIIPMMFKIKSERIPFISIDDVLCQTARYKKYGILSKDGVFVIEKNTKDKENGINVDFLNFMVCTRLSKIFNYSALLNYTSSAIDIFCKTADPMYKPGNSRKYCKLAYFNEIYSFSSLFGKFLYSDKDIPYTKWLINCKDCKVSYKELFNFELNNYENVSRLNLVPTSVRLLNSLYTVLRYLKPFMDRFQFYGITLKTALAMRKNEFLGIVYLQGKVDDELKEVISLDEQIKNL